ncbi:hypothetical protein CLV47_11066 [Antricoccus suffuscus]|uniref:Uncharacterized protein n=1 Tax=Antricoccus suffuscus TaxID=1629062 RepID=A0A2T0ZYA4_9ACTN|nr:hypothetical protein CLV47_11066 [Antricoccus suffuscus]
MHFGFRFVAARVDVGCRADQTIWLGKICGILAPGHPKLDIAIYRYIVPIVFIVK